MPAFLCPLCANLIRLPPSYSWYAGEVPCGRCQSKMHVNIGDYRAHAYKTTTPFEGSQGGLILSTPKIIETGVTVPLELVQGTDAERIPHIPREAMRTAIRNYKSLRYEDSVVRCRFTLESALEDLGISKDTPSKMVDQAIEERLLTAAYGSLCHAVTSLGRASGPLKHSRYQSGRRSGRDRDNGCGGKGAVPG